MTLSLYCDGGVISTNPSLIGGTWAWCLVEHDLLVSAACGIVTPEEIGSANFHSVPHKEFGIQTVSNNCTELLAVLKGLQSVPKGWDGTLYSDSQITLFRITHSSSFNGIPNWMRLLALDLRRNRKWKAVLVKGHPTKKHLATGKGINGLPVSKWNVHADKQCKTLAREFLEKLDKREAF